MNNKNFSKNGMLLYLFALSKGIFTRSLTGSASCSAESPEKYKKINKNTNSIY